MVSEQFGILGFSSDGDPKYYEMYIEPLYLYI